MLAPLVLGRYAFAAGVSSRRVADDQVRKFYHRPEYRENYRAERDATISHYSRAGTSAAMEALIICGGAAKRCGVLSRSERLQIAGASMNILKSASMWDQWLDDVYVKGELAQNDGVSEESIWKNISNDSWTPDILKRDLYIFVPMKSGRKRRFDHRVYFNAARLLENLYSQFLKARNDSVHRYYKRKKLEAEKFQALDIAIATRLFEGRDEDAVKILGASDYETAIRASQKLLDKTGLIGGALAVITNDLYPDYRDKASVNHWLYSFGREVGRFQQIMADDVPSICKDLIEQAPNSVILPALTECPASREQNPWELTLFLKRRPEILTDLVSPITKRMVTAAEELGKLDFAGEEAKLITKMVMKGGLKRARQMGSVIGVDFDEAWYGEVVAQEA